MHKILALIWISGFLLFFSACSEKPRITKNQSPPEVAAPQVNSPQVTQSSPPPSTSLPENFPERHSTRSGIVFERVIDPILGNSVWRDLSNPRDVRWGGLVRNQEGEVELVSWEDAIEYCINLNPQELIRRELRQSRLPALAYYLPTRTDWQNLREAFGAEVDALDDPGTALPGYLPEAWFPDLVRPESEWTWTAEHVLDYVYIYIFESSSARILTDTESHRSFRCVRNGMESLRNIPF